MSEEELFGLEKLVHSCVYAVKCHSSDYGGSCDYDGDYLRCPYFKNHKIYNEKVVIDILEVGDDE